MIFIDLNHADDTSTMICLDYIVVIYETEGGIEIHLRDQPPITFRLRLEDFYANVYSDENMTQEYTLVELYEIRPIDTSRIQDYVA